MIPLIEINNIAKKFNVATETIEKDYVISWILLCLSKSNIRNNFIFYGGTAIKRMYFEEHRFSEDIDLLSTDTFTIEYILKELSCLEYSSTKANLLLEINKDIILVTKDRVQLYINYFGYDEIIGSPKKIRLDFAMGMEMNGYVIEKDMLESYSDFKKINVTLITMSLNTILANKLGLLLDITRNEPRDLFDIWFLLQRLDEFDYNFQQVCEAFRKRLSFYPTMQILLPHINKQSIKKNWDIRLNKQIANLPDVNKVIADIIIKLKDLFN